MYVRMYVCMHAYIYAFTYTNTYIYCIMKYVIFIFTSAGELLYIFISIPFHTCIHTYMHKYIHAYTYTCGCIDVHSDIYHTYVYKDTHTNIYTYLEESLAGNCCTDSKTHCSLHSLRWPASPSYIHTYIHIHTCTYERHVLLDIRRCNGLKDLNEYVHILIYIHI